MIRLSRSMLRDGRRIVTQGHHAQNKKPVGQKQKTRRPFRLTGFVCSPTYPMGRA